MLKEVKCLLCKYLLEEPIVTWEHRCEAYPDGIPNDIFNDNRNNKNCKSEMYSYVHKTEKKKRYY